MHMERATDDWAVGGSERWLSIIAGSMLGLVALRRGSLGGLLLGTAAGFLIHRGVTRHCVVGEALFGELEQDTVGLPATDAADAPSGEADSVERASRESFPASDAPARTPTTRVEAGDEG